MAPARRHHYVPRFFLRNFCNAEGKIRVFDKLSGASIVTSPRNAAVQRGFYNLDDLGDPEAMERWLGNIESQVAPLLGHLAAGDTIVRNADKAPLAAFMATQAARTPRSRRAFEDIVTQAVPRALRLAGHRDVIATLGQNAKLGFIGLAAGVIHAELLDERWQWTVVHLPRLPSKRGFVTSDYPVIHRGIPLAHGSVADRAVGWGTATEVWWPIGTHAALVLHMKRNVGPLKANMRDSSLRSLNQWMLRESARYVYSAPRLRTIKLRRTSAPQSGIREEEGLDVRLLRVGLGVMISPPLLHPSKDLLAQ